MNKDHSGVWATFPSTIQKQSTFCEIASVDGKIQLHLFFHVMGIKYKDEHIEYTLYNEAMKYTAADTELDVLMLWLQRE